VGRRSSNGVPFPVGRSKDELLTHQEGLGAVVFVNAFPFLMLTSFRYHSKALTNAIRALSRFRKSSHLILKKQMHKIMCILNSLQGCIPPKR
jgi:hypothetical protein